jgi:hypothetical protein
VHVPNGDQAVVDQTKLTDYLLSLEHHVGRHKARFFAAHGFSGEHWEDLRRALLRHVIDHVAIGIETNAFGTKFVVEGSLDCPDGRSPVIRTVWMIEVGHQIPRLVTAYPLSRTRNDQ